MAVGRISGPLLKDNLLRNGVNLAFETNLLYLDVVNSRVGINTISPDHDLSVNGTTRTTNLYVSNQANLATFTFQGDTLSSTSNVINLLPSGTNPTVYQGTISVGNLNLNTNLIASTGTNTDINLTAIGTGTIKLNNNVLVTGDLHATGNITADGNITLGNASTDTVTFDAEVASSILPNATLTWNLGSPTLTWNNLYVNSLTSSTINSTNVGLSGDLSVNGTTTLNGTITIGNSSSNTLSVAASLTSNLVPLTTNTYDLGSSSIYWNHAYVTTFHTSGMSINSNSITATGTNSNLQLSANGTGNVYIPSNNLQVDQNAHITGTLTVNNTTTLVDTGITGTLTQTGNYTQTGNFTTTGNVQVTGNFTVSGTLTIPDISISGGTLQTTVTNEDLKLLANGTGSVIVEQLSIYNNNLSSTQTNQNILLTPQGTGSVVINNNQSLQVPVGTTLQRPSTPSNGMVRYNTDNSRYEGYASGYWTNLGGVQSVDGKTYITPESTPGAGNNVISFYANNNLTAYIDSTKLYTIDFQTSQLDISSNTISAIGSNTDINFTTSGTGGVIIGNLKFLGNTITNLSSNAITQFNSTNSGYFKFAGTYGVVIPVGSTAARPQTIYEETGMTRYNTDLGLVEIFNGTVWGNIAGLSTGVTSATAQDIGVQTALAIG
jgi:hypothetical protein